MKSRLHSPRLLKSRPRRAQSGYILLILLLGIAIIAIMMTAAATRMAHQVKRDRETEMIHRGEQYARAIKKYYKKFGRYPARVEELEKTNNIRFLRKRYKDPTTPEGNWKFVRFGEIQMGQVGANLGSVSPSPQQPQGLGSFGTPAGGAKPPDAQNAPDNPSQGDKAPGTGTAGSSSSTFGSSLTGQTFGGGPIIGVASMSEQNGIREFNNKKHYNQWFFVFDPTQDTCASPTGCLLKGPYIPRANLGGNQPGIGTPAGTMQPGMGGPGGMGGMSGMGGMGNPTQPQGFGNPPRR